MLFYTDFKKTGDEIVIFSQNIQLLNLKSILLIFSISKNTKVILLKVEEIYKKI